MSIKKKLFETKHLTLDSQFPRDIYHKLYFTFSSGYKKPVYFATLFLHHMVTKASFHTKSSGSLSQMLFTSSFIRDDLIYSQPPVKCHSDTKLEYSSVDKALFSSYFCEVRVQRYWLFCQKQFSFRYYDLARIQQFKFI